MVLWVLLLLLLLLLKVLWVLLLWVLLLWVLVIQECPPWGACGSEMVEMPCMLGGQTGWGEVR